MFHSGQADPQTMKRLRAKIRKHVREHRRPRLYWRHPLTNQLQMVIDSWDETGLDNCAQNIAGRCWIISEGAPVSFFGGDLTRDDWVESVAGKTYPEDLFRLGGLLKQRDVQGKQYNAFTLLPEDFYGHDSDTKTS